MESLLLLFSTFLLSVFSGCTAIGPAGIWSYSVTDTPKGDFQGDMVIEQSEDGYTGYLSANDMHIEFNRLFALTDFNSLHKVPMLRVEVCSGLNSE